MAQDKLHHKKGNAPNKKARTSPIEIKNVQADEMGAVRSEQATQDWLAVIPAFLLSDSTLSASAKVVYGAIASFSANGTKEAYPSHREIAVRSGMNVRSIARPLRELTKAGFIKVHRRGRTLTNTYEVMTLKSDITEKCYHNPAWSDDAGERDLSIKRILKRNSTQASADQAEVLYTYYAKNIRPGPKTDTLRSIMKLLAQYTIEDLRAAAEAYAASSEGRAEKQYRYAPNNFFGRKEYYKDYLKREQPDHPPIALPPKELTEEERATRQRLVDAGQD